MSTLKHMKMRITQDDSIYPGMKKFKVHGKELHNLPRSLFNLMELEILDLSPERETCLSFQLSTIPKEIGHLVQLKILIIDTNQIRQLPEEISMLRNLERLTLSNNQLSSLPENFHKLVHLKSLHCSNNKFKEIPEQVTQLSELTFLDFSTNELNKLPPSMGKLKNLNTLILAYNKLTSLPASIGDLENLQTLWLSANALTALPSTIANLTKLDWTSWCVSTALDDNPLQHPPLRIAKLGPQAIKKFFKERQEKPTPRYDK